MPPKQVTIPIDVIDLDSSDDEGGAEVQKASSSKTFPKNAQLGGKQPEVQSDEVAVVPVDSSYRPLDCRSFWKAGAFQISPSRSTVVEELEHARVNPKFLHTNATSHQWAFGAIAELLDNAVDEMNNGATFVKVDRIYNSRNNSPALLFQDDGGGMDPACLRKCMSLGYSSKTSNTTIGQYGNGFKTSTMRLGADVIVFTRTAQSGQATQSVGLLSYTFLRRTGQDDVIVPMIDFDISDHWAEPIIYSSQDDWSTNLKIITEWSPFTSKVDLMKQFEDIGSHGTKIIIYNLWLNDEGIYELNFDVDDEDIRLRDEASQGSMCKHYKRVLELQSHISYRIRYSLRAYASILYLRKFTNFNIILRGKPVEQFNIADELKHSKVVPYRPNVVGTSKEVFVETTIGFIKEAPALGISGFNVYHRNRLIRPFWKVIGDGTPKGQGVVGVLEANFIEPAHDKQDFERSSLFLKLELRLKQMTMEYWKSHSHLIGHQPVGDTVKLQRKLADLSDGEAANAHIPRSINMGSMHIGSPTTGHPADPQQYLDSPKSGNYCSAGLHKKSSDQTASGLSIGSLLEGTHLDSQMPASVEQISEENIQLFRRCEQYMEKENQLKHTVEQLEKELEQTRKKCAQLSANLENRKKQKLVEQLKQTI